MPQVATSALTHQLFWRYLYSAKTAKGETSKAYVIVQKHASMKA